MQRPTRAKQAVQKTKKTTTAKTMCARWGMARQLLPKYMCTTLDAPGPMAAHLQLNLHQGGCIGPSIFVPMV
jgi:hypothetical protein